METPSLKTKRFFIRAFKKKDLEAFARYRANPEIARYQSWTEYTVQDAKNLFESIDYSNFGALDNWYQLAVSTIETDKLVGDLAVYFIDGEQVEIGFTISAEYQKQNIAFEAVSEFLGYVFSALKKHRVVATTDVKNEASCRLLEKLGFRLEAHFVQNIYFKGSWGDEYQYALLRSEQKFT